MKQNLTLHKTSVIIPHLLPLILVLFRCTSKYIPNTLLLRALGNISVGVIVKERLYTVQIRRAYCILGRLLVGVLVCDTFELQSYIRNLCYLNYSSDPTVSQLRWCLLMHWYYTPPPPHFLHNTDSFVCLNKKRFFWHAVL
jgi:hypothetical protein